MITTTISSEKGISSEKRRLLGVDLCRGLAAYAVVLFHSGDEAWGMPITSSAIAFRMFFYFAVPFFLATAFHFMTLKPNMAYSTKFWKSRIERLVIPYIIWSAIFLVARIIIFTLTHQAERLQQLLQDPLSLVFFGGASYHLYFLPLLLAGTFLILLAPLLEHLKAGKYLLVFLSVVSIFLYYLLESSGNAFQLGPDIAFQNLLASWQLDADQHPILRLILVELAWIIRCLPYFLLALTLHQLPQHLKSPQRKIAVTAWAVAFILANSLGRLLLPAVLQELLLAYTLLLFSFALSNHFPQGKLANLAASVGACSFGIYLLHPFFINIIEIVARKLLPSATSSISIEFLLLLSVPCFLISWLTVTCLNKNKMIAKYLFGT